MKTAVSIPDTIYEEADRLAERLRLSRSRLYAMALERFIREHDESSMTEAIDLFIDEHGQPNDPVFLRGSLAEMKQVDW